MDLWTISLLLQAALYVFAGVMHFVKPAFYLRLMPRWIPHSLHGPSVYWSGVVEVVLGVGLLYEPTQSTSAWFIIAMLLGPFMALHITMLVQNELYAKLMSVRMAQVRIAAQFGLAFWAWMYTI
eukprot:c2162_g1_i1.p2 GENE.c2162_g1_i1~~c2162_g1_i1.p2  ORF type:complete len:124 (+),score=20.34 c2162_g1_i1:247-618(+)